MAVAGVDGGIAHLRGTVCSRRGETSLRTEEWKVKKLDSSGRPWTIPPCKENVPRRLVLVLVVKPTAVSPGRCGSSFLGRLSRKGPRASPVRVTDITRSGTEAHRVCGSNTGRAPLNLSWGRAISQTGCATARGA